ncbi:MAG: biotin/lipoyl-binding protein [Rhodocyclaceae bacterium]|nr:biotin/lipoyl-binding protein [Rhodocyclaceae bacterium]
MKLRITVEGKVYDVTVDVLEGQAGVPGPLSPVGPTPPPPVPPPAAGGAPLPPKPSSAPAAPPASGGGGGASSCVAPLAGTITKVLAKVGDEVAANAPLLVMEAMKMESTIASPAAGKISAIKVAPGDAVKEGDVLVEF